MVVSAEPDLDFPSIELVLMAYLTGALGVPADTAPPDPDRADPDSPVFEVRRVGGTDDGITDYPRVEVKTHAGSRPAAQALGERARQHLLVLGGRAVAVPEYTGPVLVDSCRTDTPPERLPTMNPDADVDVAYYRVALRRPRRPI